MLVKGGATVEGHPRVGNHFLVEIETLSKVDLSELNCLLKVESFQPDCLLKVEVLVKAGATVEGHPRFGSRTTELVSG